MDRGLADGERPDLVDVDDHGDPVAVGVVVAFGLGDAPEDLVADRFARLFSGGR